MSPIEILAIFISLLIGGICGHVGMHLWLIHEDRLRALLVVLLWFLYVASILIDRTLA